MATPLAQAVPVQGIARWALRAPIWLYRHHLGWLFGHQTLMLIHRGRKTGLPRRTVLEVLHYDRRTRAYTVAAGWGPHSDWLRNIEHSPNVVVASGGGRMAARAEVLSRAAAEAEIRYYITHHPLRARGMARMLAGRPFDPDHVDEIVAGIVDTVPIVALRPR